jgi:hypothetical protein
MLGCNIWNSLVMCLLHIKEMLFFASYVHHFLMNSCSLMFDFLNSANAQVDISLIFNKLYFLP